MTNPPGTTGEAGGAEAPFYSIVVPAYNEEKYLEAGLAAIRSAIVRGGRPAEIVVADNASTDRTAAIARDAGATVVREEVHCIARVRNTGARAARGEVLVFIDADSRMHPDTLDVIGNRLGRGDAVGGCAEVYLDRGGWEMALWTAFIKFVVYGLMRLGGGLYFCPRATFEAIGGFDETLYAAEDLDFAKRLKAFGSARGLRFVRLPEIPITTSSRKFTILGSARIIAIGLRTLRFRPARALRTKRLWDPYFYDDTLR